MLFPIQDSIYRNLQDSFEWMLFFYRKKSTLKNENVHPWTWMYFELCKTSLAD